MIRLEILKVALIYMGFSLLITMAMDKVSMACMRMISVRHLWLCWSLQIQTTMW